MNVLIVLSLLSVTFAMGEPQMVLGGVADTDINKVMENAEVCTAVNEAIQQINAGENKNYRLSSVVGARKQVVAGAKYFITFDLVDDTSTTSNNYAACLYSEDHQNGLSPNDPSTSDGNCITCKRYEVVIWSRPWLTGPDKRIITSISEL